MMVNEDGGFFSFFILRTFWITIPADLPSLILFSQITRASRNFSLTTVNTVLLFPPKAIYTFRRINAGF